MTDLEKENEKLKEMIDFKSDLISMMAHQLRTSLSASKWVLKMFLNGELGKLNEQQKVFLQKTYDNNEGMIDLVSETIDINKEDSTEITYNFGERNIVEIIEGVVHDFKAEAKERGVEIVFEKPERAVIICDCERIKTALQGLVENAIKYNKKGGMVTIKSKKTEDNITVSVSDTGIGIPESEKGKIFDKFFRTSSAKKKESVGSGLGLFAVKKIVERHKGNIWFESKEGEGSTFYISLPISIS